MTARLPDPARSRAVLVGVGDYAALPDLPAVAGNLSDLRTILTSPEGTGLPAAHCAVLADPADESEVGEALAKAAAEAEDVLFVYYAGHGLISGPANDLYLATSRTKENTVSTSALPCAELRESIRTSRARARVLVIDCCFSGRAIGQTMAGSGEVVFAEVDVEGAYILTSTAPSQTALAPAGAKHTLFTGALLTALREGVPGAGPLLTIGVLANWLRAEMTRLSGPSPRNRDDGNVSDLALAPNHAPRVHAVRALRDRVGQRLTELAATEADVERTRATVRSKIANAGLPGLPSLPGFGAVDGLIRAGRWAQAADELTAVDEALAAHEAKLEHERARAAGLVDRRDELRGKLDGYTAMAARLGFAEDEDLSALRETAWDLLWSRPCDLGAATVATTAYVAAVQARRGKER
ncbi:caspase domain-containing protein [Amycolatopsis sp. NPDC059657]|uniref:caspase family protein n=1 Tax=Amycolatopsis sp. NPDC059657 TaxID=3346899 RepID=UPI00367309C2